MGAFDQMNSKILINNNLAEDQKVKTLIHECLHAVFSEYAIDVPADYVESVVSQLTTGFSELLVQFLSYLQEKE
jgi:Zn-dependent peptidase ImmA (M78 family)